VSQGDLAGIQNRRKRHARHVGRIHEVISYDIRRKYDL
jgi:hypothetical protein